MEIEKLYDLYLAAGSLVTDSRKIVQNCLYLALKGEQFDGNRFALDSIKNGASYAIVDDPALRDEPQCIFVTDGLLTLQQLANYHRKQYQGTVIGITGSNGKTTTKELMYAVLSQHAKTHFTKGNLNNHIGVPLTLLALEQDSRFAIIEMGANHIGEIDQLCTIAEPEIGIITNVGKAHLEGFGGFEGVKKGKSELYRFLFSNKGIALVNADEVFLEDMMPDGLAYKLYGSNNECSSLDYCIQMLQEEPDIHYKFFDASGKEWFGTSNLIGNHNFQNIKTAIAIGLYFGLSGQDIVRGVEAYVADNNRSQFILTQNNRVFLDAYNANPDSVLSSLNAFFQLEGMKKVVILGDMLELGEFSQHEHERIYTFVRDQSPGNLFLVGPEYMKINAPEAVKFSTTSELKEYLRDLKINNALVFIKASRGIRLEALLEVL